MAVNWHDLPPEVRKRIESMTAGTSATASITAPRAPRPKRPVQDVPTCTWRCHECDELFTAWAAAERHGDATKHARIECVLT